MDPTENKASHSFFGQLIGAAGRYVKMWSSSEYMNLRNHTHFGPRGTINKLFKRKKSILVTCEWHSDIDSGNVSTYIWTLNLFWLMFFEMPWIEITVWSTSRKLWNVRIPYSPFWSHSVYLWFHLLYLSFIQKLLQSSVS